MIARRHTVLALALIWWVAIVAPARAQEGAATLPPGAPLLPEAALPEYERTIDHAGFIRGWDKASLKRGQDIYQQVCHNCHGDHDLPGSIPLALRFGEGRFQHGSDPFTIYQTLTRGWRMMPPQVQLVPQDKYDVIHYLREAHLREHNPDQYSQVSESYLAGLPAGDSKGPPPVKREPWREMDYGDLLIGTFEITDEADRRRQRPKDAPPDYVAPDANIAHKAIAIRLNEGDGGVAAGDAWLAFEHDTLRVAGIWSGEGFIDWHGINFDGRHVVRPRTIGKLHAETADVPGWANPATGAFEDLRTEGLDGRRYGPLPGSWAKYRGLYRHGSRAVISYTVGDAAILESHHLESREPLRVVRTLNIGRSSHDLTMRVGNAGTPFTVRGPGSLRRATEGGFELLRLRAADTPLNLAVVYGADGDAPAPPPLDLTPFTGGGPGQWTAQTLQMAVTHPLADGPFAVDRFELPPRESSPSKSWMRTTGLDFLPGGEAAVLCTWDGEVWKLDGLHDRTVRWQRIAAGLFQPLGIKVVEGEIFVSCRDQIVKLFDLNGDGETDFYACFNSDHQVTEHFHEFAMGLQADAEGNLYYAKSARHARPPLVPHHGTLLQVSADGSQTQILAHGFRAANGVCRNPDGSFLVTDQEGHWNPMNRINWVEPGMRFYGNMWSYGAPADSSDAGMEPPLCWVDKQFDRSPSELLWVDSPAWGTLNGALLHLSYGHGRLAIVPHERVGGRMQGGMAALPIPDLPTGIMRGRFHPGDGHLYVCGMSAWGTQQMHQPGGFYRIRRTQQPAHLPVGLRALTNGIQITFSDPLEGGAVTPVADRFEIETWALKRSAQYGSKHHDRRSHRVQAAELAADGRTLTLTVPDIAPCWQMSIRYRLRGRNGEPVEGEIQNTIHSLNPGAVESGH